MPFAFSAVNRICVALLYGRALRSQKRRFLAVMSAADLDKAFAMMDPDDDGEVCQLSVRTQ